MNHSLLRRPDAFFPSREGMMQRRVHFKRHQFFTGRKIKIARLRERKVYDGVSWIFVNITHTTGFAENCCWYEKFTLKWCIRLYFLYTFKKNPRKGMWSLRGLHGICPMVLMKKEFIAYGIKVPETQTLVFFVQQLK